MKVRSRNIFIYIYLQRIAKNVNDQNANSDGYAGPRDHGRSPFWRSDLRAVNGGWDRGHSGRDSGNNSAHKNLLVRSGEINEQPSNDGHDRRYQQAQLSSPPHSVTRYNATEWDAQCCSCGCGFPTIIIFFFQFHTYSICSMKIYGIYDGNLFFLNLLVIKYR